jgi:DNA polymerase-3 subunit epsilon
MRSNHDFVAIDFEYATREKGSICSVAIVSFKEGKIIDKFNSLVQPPNNEYELRNTFIHNIHSRLTEHAPSFVEIFPEIYKRLNHNTVVAHGAFQTDKICLEQAISLHNIEATLDIEWECTHKICECRLDVACMACNIELSHHDALSDAICCGLLYVKYLENDLPFKEFHRIKNEQTAQSHNINYPNHLTGDVLKPDFENAKNKNNPFYKKKIVISGFSNSDKERIANELKELGADVDTAVGNNTNYLIIGDNVVGPVKLAKMQANITKGKNAKIISLAEFNEMKNNDTL